MVKDDKLIAMDVERMNGDMGHQIAGVVNCSHAALETVKDHSIVLATLDVRSRTI